MKKQRGIVFTMLVAIVSATGAISMVAVGSYSSLSVCNTEKATLEASDKLAVAAQEAQGIKSDTRVWRQCMRKTVGTVETVGSP